MKFENNPNETLFEEHVIKVVRLFHQWNDCHRVVTLCALLKHLPFSGTKLIQSIIQKNLQESQSIDETKKLERNANSAEYLNSLSETYKNLKFNEVQLTKDSIFFESDRSIDKIDKFCDKKENILNEILKMLPILTVGNDEAKLVYMNLVPVIVEDVTRRVVNVTLVTQIFSYLLIHPAFSKDDRRSLGKHLDNLQEHITQSNDLNFLLYRNGTSPTSEPAKSSTASSWQAIAPPQSKSTETISSSHLANNYSDDKEYRKTIGNIIDFKSTSTTSHLYDNGDDHDISFSKNGTDITDNDNDYDTSNTVIYDKSSNLACYDKLNVKDYLPVPGFMDNIMLKTRRSHSLTTTGSSPKSSTSFAKNLAVQKPRSYSLSLVSPRSSLTSSGSDIRLDDFKPNFTNAPSNNVGMSNVGQWLKSLRLHKYTYLFNDKTYEQMLEIDDDYLQEMEVTQGARNKIVTNIQKLKERYQIMCQDERDLIDGTKPIGFAIDNLSNIVVTPMKPVDYETPDVSGQLLKVLLRVFLLINTKPIEHQDEDHIDSLLRIFDYAVSDEAFNAHAQQLREHRYDIMRIKQQFPAKNSYLKGSNNGGSVVTTSSCGNISRSRHSNLYQDFLESRLSKNYQQKISNNFNLQERPYSYDEFKVGKSRESMIKALNSTLLRPQTYSQVIRNDMTSSIHRNASKMPHKNPRTGKTILSPLSSIFQPLLKQDDNVFKLPLPPKPRFADRSSNYKKFRPPHLGSVISLVSSASSEGYCSAEKSPISPEAFIFTVGMRNIPQWLKSLRLHKYTKFFDNVTYEAMLTFTETYFKETLDITQGASRKLGNCIEKLKSRIEFLQNIEVKLNEKEITTLDAFDGLLSIVLSPMKPIDPSSDDDVSGQFWKVFNLAFEVLSEEPVNEHSINKFKCVAEKAEYSEPFITLSYQLRKMKAKIMNRKYRTLF